MQRSEILIVGPVKKSAPQDISKWCILGYIYAQKTKRIKFFLRYDKDLNYSIHEEIFYIDRKLKLKVRSKAKGFQPAKRVKELTSNNLCRTLMVCDIDVCLDLLIAIPHVKKNPATAAFQSSVDMFHIQTISVSSVSANSVLVVERRQVLISSANNLFQDEVPNVKQNEALQM